MAKLILLFMGSLSLWAAGGVAPIKIFEVDGTAQTGRVTTFAMVFARGDIANCSVPLVGDVALDTAHYQVDVGTRWDDGSLQHAKVAVLNDFAAYDTVTMVFQSGSCNNTGYLDKAAMLAFNSSSWNAQMVVVANGMTQTVDATTMLAALSVTAGQIEYERRGPLVTKVRVQDITSTFAYDFGWHLSTTMQGCSGSACTPATALQYCSLSPKFDLMFIPSMGVVRIEYILNNGWSGRAQDQVYTITFKAGVANTSMLTESIRQVSRTSVRKVFWSGTAPGHVRMDWNWDYLISTKLFPYYDRRTLVTSTVDPSADYTSFISSDMGEIGGGHAMMDQAYSGNNEGALEHMPGLRYVYLMKNADSLAAAKAWDIWTGEVDNVRGLTGVPGGAGYASILQNVPFHNWESRSSATTAYYYCPRLDTPNVTPQTSCDGTVTGQGRNMSRDFDKVYKLNATATPVAAVGDVTLGGWDIEVDGAHFIELSYMPYMLFGDRWYLDQLWDAAHYVLSNVGSDDSLGSSNGVYAFTSVGWVSVRAFGWSMQVVGKAVRATPDLTPQGAASPEKAYLLAKMKINFGMLEGFMGITGTTLSPTSPSPNTTCSGFDATTARPWEFGRCSPYVGQNIATTQHTLTQGQCPGNNGDAASYVDPTKATDFSEPFFHSIGMLSMGDLLDKGFSFVAPAFLEASKLPLEQVGDPAYNPFLAGVEAAPLRNGVAACSGPSTTNAYFTTKAQVKAAFLSPLQTLSAWGAPYTFPCDNHNPPLFLREALSFSVNSSSGTYTGQAAWDWITVGAGAIPYFGSGCGPGGDAQLRHALLPRPVSRPITIGKGTVSGKSVIQ